MISTISGGLVDINKKKRYGSLVQLECIIVGLSFMSDLDHQSRLQYVFFCMFIV